MRLCAYIIGVALLFSGCSGTPYVVEPEPEAQLVRSHVISIVNHGWHLGLILPGSELNKAVPELKDRFGEPAYYEVGWGDKGYYQASEVTTGLTVQAMFFSKGAVIHVVAMPESPEKYFEGEPILKTCISDNELAALRKFIASSFARDSSGIILPLKKGIYGDSQFYDGVGRYSLRHTCNNWTAKALRSSGHQLHHPSKLTARSVMQYLKKHGRTGSR